MSMGRHIVITGGGSGVGAATAMAFAASGAKVTIMGRRVQPLKAQGLPHARCDVTDRASVAEAFEEARRTNGPIFGVIASAGAVHSVPFERMTADDLDTMISVNLAGVINVWQAALPDMKAKGAGRLLAISSTAGLRGYAYVSAYCAAKHAVLGLTRAVAKELARTGITVNAICPGFVETPLLDSSIANIAAKTGMSREDAAGALRANNPQGRFVQPEEVAEAALWLASDGASAVNGHALALSGGEI